MTVCLIVEGFAKFFFFSKVSYHCGSFAHWRKFFTMLTPIPHSTQYHNIFEEQLEDSCLLEPAALSLTVFIYILSIVCS